MQSPMAAAMATGAALPSSSVALDGARYIINNGQLTLGGQTASQPVSQMGSEHLFTASKSNSKSASEAVAVAVVVVVAASSRVEKSKEPTAPPARTGELV